MKKLVIFLVLLVTLGLFAVACDDWGDDDEVYGCQYGITLDREKCIDFPEVEGWTEETATAACEEIADYESPSIEILTDSCREKFGLADGATRCIIVEDDMNIYSYMVPIIICESVINGIGETGPFTDEYSKGSSCNPDPCNCK